MGTSTPNMYSVYYGPYYWAILLMYTIFWRAGKEGGRLFSVVSSNRTSSNGYKLEHFHLWKPATTFSLWGYLSTGMLPTEVDIQELSHGLRTRKGRWTLTWPLYFCSLFFLAVQTFKKTVKNCRVVFGRKVMAKRIIAQWQTFM